MPSIRRSGSRAERHVDMGAIEKAKHITVYRDEQAAALGLYDAPIDDDDVAAVHEVCRQVVAAVGDDNMMRVGRVLYLSDRPTQ